MDYSQADINFMRQDALRRTREMHNRSGYRKSNVQAGDYPPEESREEKPKNKGNVNSNTVGNVSGGNANPLNGLLSGFFRDGKVDNEKVIIIALIVILAREGADLKLLIALGYILM